MRCVISDYLICLEDMNDVYPQDRNLIPVGTIYFPRKFISRSFSIYQTTAPKSQFYLLPKPTMSARLTPVRIPGARAPVNQGVPMRESVVYWY